jgi:glycogen debranching enzyme
MTGRVDNVTWFLIGCGEYWAATRDDNFLRQMMPVMGRAWALLGAWEFNQRGMIYVPETGDWADEYLQHGYVLYDEVLYYQAGRVMLAATSHLGHDGAEGLREKQENLRRAIFSNFWVGSDARLGGDAVYDEEFARAAKKVPARSRGRHWLPFCSANGYGYRFDAFANVLVSLLGLATEERCACVDRYVAEEIREGTPGLLPAFHPVIREVDEDWEELRMTFSYSFRNRPHEYHNGGLWPMIGGFLAAERARRGRVEEARAVLGAIHRANALVHRGGAWSFPEYLHGVSGSPGGTSRLGWSAAAAVIGHHALDGRLPFRLGDSVDSPESSVRPE